MLAERRARTSGAIEQAKRAIAAAEAETAKYEEKLRAARAEIFHMRDQRVKQWNAEREAALGLVRQHTQDRVRGAKQEIEQSAHEARLQIAAVSEELSSKIINAVLPADVRAAEVAR